MGEGERGRQRDVKDRTEREGRQEEMEMVILLNVDKKKRDKIWLRADIQMETYTGRVVYEYTNIYTCI